jgi:hypothetical protein
MFLPIATCSGYVPGATKIVSPSTALESAVLIIWQAVAGERQSLTLFFVGETYKEVVPCGVGLPPPPKLHPLVAMMSKRTRNDPVILERRKESGIGILFLPYLCLQNRPEKEKGNKFPHTNII